MIISFLSTDWITFQYVIHHVLSSLRTYRPILSEIYGIKDERYESFIHYFALDVAVVLQDDLGGSVLWGFFCIGFYIIDIIKQLMAVY